MDAAITNNTNNTNKKGRGTLLASMLLSAPGPLVLGIGLIFGRSSAQIADLIRRSVEFAAIVIAFICYKEDGERERKASRLSSGVAMCVAAVAVTMATAFKGGQSGSVILPLIIALLGAITNGYFAVRFTRMKEGGILETQARLYTSKAFVDVCVCAALLAVTMASGAAWARYMDIGGSVIVSLYLIISGIRLCVSAK